MPALLLAFLCSAVPAFSQAFVAEWTASANGGVGPTGTALATEAGTTYLYVSDHPRGRIIKFNATTGAVAAVFGTQGSGNGQFNQPYGIAIAPNGDLYVAERGNNRVQRITNTGTFVMAWGTAGSAPGQFNEPTGVAVDAAGDVYVSEHTNHRVQKFRVTQTGTAWSAAQVAMWGSLGNGNGQFNTPYGITVDAAGNVWVADGLNGRVQRFNTSGVHQSTLGAAGTAPGQFVVATGVTTDASGALFVTSTNADPQNAAASDANSQWVSKFSAAGAFVSRWGGAYGGGPGQFRLPFSVAISAANRAFVADYYNSRVQVFDLTAAPDSGAPTLASFTIASSTATNVTYQLTFSEPVTGVDSADFAVVTAGGATATIGAVSGTGATYMIPVAFTGTGTVQLNLKATGTGIADLGGTALATGATGPVHTISGGGTTDTTPPAVASFTTTAPTATSVSFQITFTESVTGVDRTDFTAVTTGGATATIGTVTGSGTTYVIPVTTTGTGTVQLNLNASGTGIADASSNAIAAGATGPVHTIGSTGGTDTTALTVSSFTVGATTATTVTFQIGFSESVVGVNAADFTAVTTGGATATIGATTGTGASYSIPVTFTGTGTIKLNLNATGTGIADASGNALVGGSSGPTFTIGGGGSGGAARIVSVTAPANGTYLAGQTLTFTVTFSGPVTVKSGGDEDDDDVDADDDDDDEGKPYFTWSAVGTSGQKVSSGRVAYGSGSGTTALKFTYKVRKDDAAPGGISLGTTLQLPNGATIKDGSGNLVTGGALTLPWALNPLPNVILKGESSDDGKDKGKGPVVVIKRGDGILAGQPFTLPATTATGQPITWVLVSGNATLNGNVLTPKNKGAVVVRAIVAGTSTSPSAATDFEIEGEDEARESKSHGKAPHRDRLSNLSSRLRVSGSGGDRPGIAGFVVTGNSAKQVLVRAIGPSLAAFGVNDAVASVRLQLHDQTGGVIAENDGWKGDATIRAAGDRVGAFALASGSRDSALLVTLRPGAYTAQVGATGSGIALLEVYDATGAAVLSTEQLVNISTRGFVDSGDGSLIAGFVVTGDAPKRVLVRGIGAALASFGVAGTLGDPVLELYTAGGTNVLARNDDWETPQRVGTIGSTATAAEVLAASRATGAFPLASGSKDAAILITLMPGSYSAVVSGANKATGAGLVEVYEVPNP